ncbi:hypothetical protein CDO52_22285 [Nocardiopsis gilva YIM 90087]|uniref:Uncharacterized protein n=2 Tax=Nocardiopsis gilva TaxID=280236 RepID=A0A223SAK9_9ACTN|nr:hypothetical protein [Nocardiopsis gilva]ASU85155.1 hypothetical protein CDO52_22285 [Nocardiopsis gilva YIM 90087]
MWGWWRTRGELPHWSIAFHQEPVTLTFSSRLPSSDAGLRFSAQFAMRLSFATPDTHTRSRLETEARREALVEAARETRHHTVADHGAAEAETACRLHGLDVFDSPRITAHDITVRITAEDEDIATVKRRERTAALAAVDAAEHEVRMRRVETLANDVLTDPLRARIWWYEQHPDRLLDVESAGRALETMIATRGRVVDGTQRFAPANSVIDGFLHSLPPDDREDVLERLVGLLTEFERDDLAETLQERWSEAVHGAA